MSGKKSIVFLTFLSCLILFIGCDFKETLKKQIEKFVPEETDKFARTYIDIVRKGDIEEAEELLDPRAVNSKTESALQQCVDYLNKGEPISIELIGADIFNIEDKRRSNLSYQLQFKNEWLLVNVIVVDISGKQQILGFHVNPLSRSLEEINAFTFSDKTFRHYIIILIAIGIPVFIIYTIVLCVRSKMKRKWLWIIFMFFGVGSYSFNWTNGVMGFQPLSIRLIPTSVFRGGPYAPWIIYISVPIGALAFILKRRKIKKRESAKVLISPDSNDIVTDEVDS